jgi:hypothetical protein
MRIFTIGGYGFTEERFRQVIQDANVDTFLDVRQRRGMRGSKYAFLNSLQLQDMLSQANIKYIYAPDLAPTTSIRNAQKQVDMSFGVEKRNRCQLSSDFIERYQHEILANVDSSNILGGFHDVTMDFIFRGRKLVSVVSRSAGTSFLPALRQRPGCEIRTCAGQATMVVSTLPVPVHAS